MTTEEKIIKNKLGLIKLANMLGNVSQACKVMGYSRDSFYRFKELYDQGGELALQEISRKKPCIKNRVEEHIETAVAEFAIEKPAYGQLRTSNELKKKGLFVSPGGVRSIWLRHDLETFKKRLESLEAKAAQESLVLTEEQVRALEKAKDEKESHEEIESPSSRVSGGPGYLLRGHAQGCRQDLPAAQVSCDLRRSTRRLHTWFRSMQPSDSVSTEYGF